MGAVDGDVRVADRVAQRPQAVVEGRGVEVVGDGGADAGVFGADRRGGVEEVVD